MTTHIPQGIFEVKDEHGHDSGRLAQSIISLRELCAAYELTIKQQREEIAKANTFSYECVETIDLKDAEILQRGKTIDEQEREIANFAEAQNEAKLLFAELQRKYTAQVEATNQALLALATSETKRANDATAHLEYVNEMNNHMKVMDSRLSQRIATQRQINGLVEENRALMQAVSAKYIWRRIRIPFTDIFRRHQESVA